MTLIVLVVWLASAVPAALFVDGAPILVTLIAALVCLAPSGLTLVLLDWVHKRSAEERIVATLAAPFIRMIVAGGGGIALYYLSPLINAHGLSFISWIVVFYLVTLAVETRLLYIDTTYSAPAELSNR